MWSTKNLDVDINKEHVTETSGTIKNKDPSLTDNGRQPGTLKAQIEVWDPKDWDTLQTVLKAVWPTKELTERDAYDISHPSPDLVGIKKVIVTNIVVPPPMEQSLVVELSLLEFFPLRSKQQRKYTQLTQTFHQAPMRYRRSTPERISRNDRMHDRRV